MQTLPDKGWHHLPAAEAATLLGADPENGLEEAEVRSRRERFGPNALTEHKGRGPVLRFLLQLHQPLVYILLGAAAVTLTLQEWVDAGVIIGVVIVNAIIGFLQEAKALEAIRALSRHLSSETTVVRAGRRGRVSSVDLVPGDLVLLQSGDKVPADMRLVRTRDLRVDESALTGESVPVEKNEETLGRETVLADRRNMAYSSTLVTFGTARGVVVGTGDRTEIGRISEMIARTETLDTPLTLRIKQFSHVLLYVILALAAFTLAIGILRGQPWLETSMAAVALAVGAIPEGLPAAITIMLAIGVSRMARRRAIIRRLPAVETLGSTSVICSDKTGTLTQNQMTVQEIAAADAAYAVSGAGYDPAGEIRPLGGDAPESNAALSQTLLAGLLCNEAELHQADGHWSITGDPTEGALVVSAVKGGLERTSAASNHPLLDTLAFESAHQYMATLHGGGRGERIVYVKGSLEALLPKCRDALDAAGQRRGFDGDAISRVAERMAAKGLRVLAFARKSLPGEGARISHADLAGELTFLGLQGMIDPPRPEAARAIAACRRAGVQVKMITGDHALTAVAIAGQLGLIDPGEHTEGTVVTGQALANMGDDELARVARRASVFARVTPEHKLRLVQALQSQSHVVAMTGDGVNDAPALRRADIGVAMALGGTEVAREASDMMLTDDNFASIQAAVEEGRGVFDNLRKFIVWTLPTNGGEGLVILLAVLLGVTLPILPVQILWINMTTAICLGLMLAFEPKENDIMHRPPHPSSAPILDRHLAWRIVLVSLLLCAGAFGTYQWELALGASEGQARTAAVAVFVLGETFYLLNCRSLTRSVFSLGLGTNPWIWVGIAIMVALQLAFTYVPALNEWFDSEPVSWQAWLRAAGIGILIFAVVGLDKTWRRRRPAVRDSRPAKMGVA